MKCDKAGKCLVCGPSFVRSLFSVVHPWILVRQPKLESKCHPSNRWGIQLNFNLLKVPSPFSSGIGFNHFELGVFLGESERSTQDCSYRHLVRLWEPPSLLKPSVSHNFQMTFRAAPRNQKCLRRLPTKYGMETKCQLFQGAHSSPYPATNLHPFPWHFIWFAL